MYSTSGTIRALHDHVIVADMQFGERKTASGIIILDDDAKSRGIRPRWARVYATGPEQQDVTVNQWVLIEHGRWTRGFKLTEPSGTEVIIRRVDAAGIMATSETPPLFDDTVNWDAA